MAFKHTEHWLLWDWLAKNPGKWKEDWPGWKEIDEYVPALCFACQVRDENRVNPCPLGHEYVGCSIGDCLGGLYAKWEDVCGNPLKRADLARQIRDLPIKEGVECE
jgi:hypothetical protein